MVAYKVLQDIEAEDKLVGPMTARQLLYAGVTGAFLFVGYLVSDKSSWWVMVIFALPALPFAYLAAPLGRDQPNDVWLFAQINYYLRPRKRVWKKGSATQKLIIKAKSEPIETNKQSKATNETANSRLKNLANTLDGRTKFEFPDKQVVSGQPIIDPYLSDEHPVASRFDFLLGQNQQQPQIQTSQTQVWAPTTPQPPISQSPAIAQLANTDDLKVSTIAQLANQSGHNPNQNQTR